VRFGMWNQLRPQDRGDMLWRCRQNIFDEMKKKFSQVVMLTLTFWYTNTSALSIGCGTFLPVE
uniref:Uncharacterized protein n=1 Tax=Laticauda laticaudata TaxID=8630 RepID=A0A8C5S607_LATLA